MLESAFSKVSDLAAQNCISQIDDWLLDAIGAMIRPTCIFIALIIVTEITLKIIEAGDYERIVLGLLFLSVLVASIVATIALGKMIYDARALLAVLWRARISPRQFLRAAIFTRALEVIDAHKAEWPTIFSIGDSVAAWKGCASLSDTLALRVVQAAAPAIERHVMKRAVAVMLPILGIYAYLRYDLLPSLAHAEGQFAIMQAGMHPILAAWRLIVGP